MTDGGIKSRLSINEHDQWNIVVNSSLRHDVNGITSWSVSGIEPGIPGFLIFLWRTLWPLPDTKGITKYATETKRCRFAQALGKWEIKCPTRNRCSLTYLDKLHVIVLTAPQAHLLQSKSGSSTIYDWDLTKHREGKKSLSNDLPNSGHNIKVTLEPSNLLF